MTQGRQPAEETQWTPMDSPGPAAVGVVEEAVWVAEEVVEVADRSGHGSHLALPYLFVMLLMGLALKALLNTRCLRRYNVPFSAAALVAGVLVGIVYEVRTHVRRKVGQKGARGRCRGGGSGAREQRPVLPSLPHTRTAEGGLTMVLTAGVYGGSHGGRTYIDVMFHQEGSLTRHLSHQQGPQEVLWAADGVPVARPHRIAEFKGLADSWCITQSPIAC